MKTNKRKLPKCLMEARIQPRSFNEEKRTIEVIWTTGAAVKRFDWSRGEFFMEELSMKPENVRMERFTQGTAPVLNTHSQATLDDVIGVVERAELRGDQGVATVRLSSREDIAGLVRDIRDGIIRNVSVGYKIHKAEETRDESNNMSVFRVVDWEPLELSFVPVPADPEAISRSENIDKSQSFDCEIINISKKGDSMQDENEAKEDLLLRNEESNEEKNELPDSSPEILDEGKEETPEESEEKPEESSEESEESESEESEESSEESEESEERAENLALVERNRITGILELSRSNSLDNEFTQKLINESVSLKEAGEIIIKEVEKRNNEKKTNNTLEIQTMENKQLRKEAMVRGLLHRNNPTKYKLNDGDQGFVAGSVIDLARMYLSTEMGVRDVFTLSKDEVAKRALHHTSDFPEILKDSCNKSLMDGYQEVAATYSPFVRERSVSDFKDINSARISSGGILQKVNEHGEYKRSTIAENGETYRIETYGEVIGATRRLLVNDDLNAFTQLPLELGAKIARTENETFWELVYTPQIMSDGLPIFHADHGNLGTGGAIADATLSEARKLMRLQKDLDGLRRLNIIPKYLVVPAGQENEALKFLTTVSPDSVANVNTFGSSMQLIVEPILDDADANAWYVLGDLSQGPMGEHAKLDGRGPEIFVRDNWDIDGMEVKIRYEFGMRIVDFRQFFKNAGV